MLLNVKKTIVSISLIILLFILIGCATTGKAVAFECSTFVDAGLSGCSEDLNSCADSAHETLEQYGYGHCYEDGVLESCIDICIEDESYVSGCIINCIDEMESGEIPSEEPGCAVGLTECKESDGSSGCWDLTNSIYNCGVCGNKCIEGAQCLAGNCVSGGDGPAKLGCNENDGGISIYNKGNLITPEGKEFTDFCVESEAYPYVSDGSSNAIYEYYCFSNVESSKNNFVDSGTIVNTCPFGKSCTNGACEERKCNGKRFDMKVGTTKTVTVDGKEYVVKLNKKPLFGLTYEVSSFFWNKHPLYKGFNLALDYFPISPGTVHEIIDGSELLTYDLKGNSVDVCLEVLPSPKAEIKKDFIEFAQKVMNKDSSFKDHFTNKVIYRLYTEGKYPEGYKPVNWDKEELTSFLIKNNQYIPSKENIEKYTAVIKPINLFFGNPDNLKKQGLYNELIQLGYDFDKMIAISLIDGIGDEVVFKGGIYYPVQGQWKMIALFNF